MRRLSVTLLLLVGLLAIPSLFCTTERAFAGEWKGIPIERMWSTTGQKNVRQLHKGSPDTIGRELAQIYEKLPMGASNIFLVQGEDIRAAARATRRALINYQPVHAPVYPDDEAKVDQLWVLVYFGSAGSTPPRWVLRGASEKEDTIRIGFEEPKREGGGTDDLSQYFAWVPITKQSPGTLMLELYDVEKKEVVLMRRVTIPVLGLRNAK
jgi:hypothetical protein